MKISWWVGEALFEYEFLPDKHRYISGSHVSFLNQKKWCGISVRQKTNFSYQYGTFEF